MNLTILSKVLTKLYNKLGNNYLTKNFITEPFEFDVKVRYDRDNYICDYIIEVSSISPMPDSFDYKPELNKDAHGVHISVVQSKFLDMYRSIEPIDDRKRYACVEFMNKLPR